MDKDIRLATLAGAKAGIETLMNRMKRSSLKYGLDEVPIGYIERIAEDIVSHVESEIISIDGGIDLINELNEMR